MKDYEKKLKRLMPKIQPRLDRLPPEFTENHKAALLGAEGMFRLQGGSAPIINVHTTEDGDFLSPMPASAQSNQEMTSHLADLLAGKPGATAAYFSYTATPEGGGSTDGRSCLCCLYMTRQCLFHMRAEITGVRSLGPWTMKAYPRKEPPKPAAFQKATACFAWEGPLPSHVRSAFLEKASMEHYQPHLFQPPVSMPLLLVSPQKHTVQVFDGKADQDRQLNIIYKLTDDWCTAEEVAAIRNRDECCVDFEGQLVVAQFAGPDSSWERGLFGVGKPDILSANIYLLEPATGTEARKLLPIWEGNDPRTRSMPPQTLLGEQK